MASLVKDDQSIESGSDDEARRDRAPRPQPQRGGKKPPPPVATRAKDRGPGFFHIYKKGQGYWTRMGTVIGAAVILLLTVSFLYSYLPVWVRPLVDHSASLASAEAKTAELNRATLMARDVSIGLCAGFLVGAGLLCFWLINRPTNADFLIATDSEMKKVNWTSRKELIGSTKVVIVFMFLVAIMLFVFDIFFGYLFYYVDVLKSKPF